MFGFLMLLDSTIKHQVEPASTGSDKAETQIRFGLSAWAPASYQLNVSIPIPSLPIPDHFPLSSHCLHTTKNEKIIDSGVFAEEQGINHDEIVNVIKSLHGFRVVEAQGIKKESWQVTDEGKTYFANGTPEYHLFMAIPQEGISTEDLMVTGSWFLFLLHMLKMT